MNFNALEKTWVIAEIGVNHEGNEDVAHDLVRKAAAAGADAVKFQTYEAAEYVSSVQPERRARVERFQLSQDAFRRLADTARAAGITFFSTPLGPRDVIFLSQVAPLIKISSGDLTYLPLIQAIAETGKPIILSTGLGTEAEIRRAVDTILSVRPSAAKDGSVALLHCVSAYPTPPEAANLRNIAWLKDTFGLPVGYSDHTLGIKTAELAVAAGARIIEKHFTYRIEDQAFHDHALSADPAMMKDLIQAIRNAEVLLGRYDRVPQDCELAVEKHMRRSIAASRDLAEGQVVTAGDITYLRPAWGLLPNQSYLVLGHRVRRAVPAGDLIKQEDLAD